jgi:hypothetical protein
MDHETFEPVGCHRIVRSQTRLPAWRQAAPSNRRSPRDIQPHPPTAPAALASVACVAAFTLTACFARLLSNLSTRFAVAEVEIASRQLLKFLDFDRGNFVEFTDGGATVPAQG